MKPKGVCKFGADVLFQLGRKLAHDSLRLRTRIVTQSGKTEVCRYAHRNWCAESIDHLTRMTMKSRLRQILGWVCVVLATLATSFLGFWGILENFHEGWHHSTLLLRLVWMFAYLSFMFVFMALSLIAVRWPWAGFLLFAGIALFCLWFFHASKATIQMLVAPASLLAVGFAVGRPTPKCWAYRLITVLPLLTVLVVGIYPAWRVANRVDDGNRGIRHLSENGVDLIWAPKGPGWPTQGMSWHDARERCRYLTEDGASVAETILDVWRLPTVEEAVRSQCLHGENSGGSWDAATATASYQQRPDKESPLWDIGSQVVYWWTATEVNDEQAYIIVYDGKVWPRPKGASQGNLGFRAVKAPTGQHAN